MVLDGSLNYVQCVPYAVILQIFLLFAWFDTGKFNCLPCPNNEMYDDAVFADRFRYQLTMFGIRVLIGYLDTFMLILHMKKIAPKSSQHSAKFPIVYMIWYVWIQSSAMFNNKTYDDLVLDDRFRYKLTMFEVCILIGLSRFLNTHIAYEIAIKNH